MIFPVFYFIILKPIGAFLESSTSYPSILRELNLQLENWKICSVCFCTFCIDQILHSLCFSLDLSFPVLSPLTTLFPNFLLSFSFLQVLNEDLRLVVGQQDRMINGANVWNLPVSYDKLGVRYRMWRDAVDRGVKQLPFSKSV